MNKVDVVKKILNEYSRFDILHDSMNDMSAAVVEWSEIGTHSGPIFKGTFDECMQWLFDKMAKEIVSALEA